MPSTRVENFTLEMRPDPLNAYVANEGELVVATYAPGQPFISTYGLYVCKAVAIYNAESKRGLLAHMSFTRSVRKSVANVVEAYGSLEASNVHIMQGSRAVSKGFPPIGSIAEELLEYHPKNLLIDPSLAEGITRAVALNLMDGAVHEIDRDNQTGGGSEDRTKSQRIHHVHPWNDWSLQDPVIIST